MRINNMKKILIIGIMAIMLIGMVNAIEVDKDVYKELTDEEIADYMISNFNLVDFSLDYSDEKLYTYWSLIKVTELENTVDVSTVWHRSDLTFNFVNWGIGNYGVETFVTYGVMGIEVINYTNNNQNYSVTPAYLQAYNVGVNYYSNAIALRDKLNQQTDYTTLISLINQSVVTTTTTSTTTLQE